MDTLDLLMKTYPGRILLTVDETACACGLAPGTIRTRLSRKTFPVVHRKEGDKTMFHIEAVARYIDGLPSVGARGRGRPRKVEAIAQRLDIAS
jgi:hypothetical protein